MSSLAELKQSLNRVHQEMENAANYQHYEDLGEQYQYLKKQYRKRLVEEIERRRHQPIQDLRHRIEEIQDRLYGAGNQEHFEALGKELARLRSMYRNSTMKERARRSRHHANRNEHMYPRHK